MSLFGPPNVQKLISNRDGKGLIKALAYTKDAMIRESAAKALGKLKFPQATQPLCNALKDENEEVRIAATSALISIQDNQAIDALISALNDQSVNVRRMAVKALEPLKSPKRVAALIERLDDKDTVIRQMSAKALGNIGDQQAEDKLIDRLNDTMIDVINAAVIALGKIKSPKAVEPLISIITAPPRVQLDSGWNETKLYAIEALGLIGDARAVRPLLELITSGRNVERKAGKRAMNQLGDNLITPLVSTLKESGTDMQNAASEFLVSLLKSGKKFDDPNINELIELSDSSDENSRNASVNVLLHVDQPSVAPILVKALSSEKTRQQAETTLVKIGKPAGLVLKGASKKASGDMAEILRKLMIKTGYLELKHDQVSQNKVAAFNAFNVRVDDYVIHLPTSQFAFRQFGGDKPHVVLNGKNLQGWDGVWGLTFSKDGGHFGYIARNDKTRHAIIDEKPGPSFEDIGFYDTFAEPARNYLVLTSDGHSGYPVKDKGRWGVARDHKVDLWFDGIMTDSVVFSSDGKHLAFAAQDKDRWFMVLDGVQGKSFAMIGLASINFSPDGDKLAYSALKNRSTEQWCLMENEVELAQFQGGEPPVYSPNSQRLAYGSKTQKGITWMVDGKAQGAYSGVLMAGFRFSPDSMHHAFIARKGERNCLIRDGKIEGAYYDYADPPVFSPDSQHCAFSAQKGHVQYIILDGKEIDSHQYIGESSASFSPDSKALAYEGIDGTKRRVFIKQTQGEIFDFIFTTNNGGIYFDTNNQIHYLAQKDAIVYWVTEKLEWVEG